MTELNIKKIVEELIDTFFHAGKVSLDLRDKGLTKKIKSDLENSSAVLIALDLPLWWISTPQRFHLFF